MKKLFKLLLVFVMCFMVSGCGEQVKTCTKPASEEDEFKTTSTYTLKYDKEDKIVKVTKIDTVEVDSNMIDYTIDMENEVIKKFENIEGIKMSIKKTSDTTIQKVLTINYKKLDDKQLEDNNLSSNALYSKKLNLEKFEKYFLSDYECN